MKTRPSKPNTTNVAISNDTHKRLIDHTQKNDTVIRKFVDRAVLEKIERDSKK